MIRGTTPTLTLTIPDSTDLDLTQVEAVYVTLHKLEKTVTIRGDALTVEPHAVKLRLSQEESLSFFVGTVEVQLNWLYRAGDGALCRGATKVQTVNIDKQLLLEVI